MRDVLSTLRARCNDLSGTFPVGILEGPTKNIQMLLKSFPSECINRLVQTGIGCLVDQDISTNVCLPRRRCKEGLHTRCDKGFHEIDTRTIGWWTIRKGSTRSGPNVENLVRREIQKQLHHHQRFVHAFCNGQKLVLTQDGFDRHLVIVTGGRVLGKGFRIHQFGGFQEQIP